MIKIKLQKKGVMLSLLLFTITSFAQTSTTKKPNIIWIVADDLGNADVGFNGLTDFKTPSIDKLAADGVVCSNAYAMHPFCGPSRAGLMSGRYQQRFGFYGNPLPKQAKNYDPEFGLPTEETTIAEVLKEEGYRTGIVGKWHLGSEKKFHPLSQGFTDFFGFIEGHTSYYKTNNLKWQSLSATGQWELKNRDKKSRKLYMTDLLSDEAVAFVKSTDKKQPFFLYMAYNAPHAPMHATQEWLDKVADIKDPMRRIYAAMVTSMDDGIGKLIKHLKARGEYENTLIFFMSDNGGIEPYGSNNGVYRGVKGNLLEGGIHVPFSVTWPAQFNGGKSYHKNISAIDAYAASIIAAGGKIPSGADGVDIIPFITDENYGIPHESLFWLTGGQEQWAVRFGNKKIYHVAGLEDRMYNLEYDVSEEYPQKVDKKIEKRYRKWLAELPPTKVSAQTSFKRVEQAEAAGLKATKEQIKRTKALDKRMRPLLKKAIPKEK